MIVGNTVREIFGSLPDEDALRQQPLDQTVRQTNLHIHLPPNFGSITSVAEAVNKAKAEDIAVLGASNYYDHTIYSSFAHTAIKAGIVPVFGIEILTMNEKLRQQGILINDPKNPGKGYLCGKGLAQFDNISGNALVTWKQIQEGDKKRIEEMLDKLNAIDLLRSQGIQLRYHEIAQAIAEEKQVPVTTVFLQERHIAQALQQAIFQQVSPAKHETFLQQLYQTDKTVDIRNIVTIQNELRNALLKQRRIAYVGECFVSPEEAAEMILNLGGYVSCPILIDGAPQILPGEGTPDELTTNLLDRQIGAAEFIPTRNDITVLTEYVTTLRRNGIVVGAGTEHNAATWIPLRIRCRGGVLLSEELTRIFWEGACVAVAHQYLSAKGNAGFRFLPDLVEREKQIQYMAELGARVVRFFRNRNKTT